MSDVQDKASFMWFAADSFKPRVSDASVIPIYLDDTKFVGIPDDIIGISFKNEDYTDEDVILDKIIIKLDERLQYA